MKALIRRVGPCTMTPISNDPFTMLVRCVVYQQISTKAARSIFDRLTTAAGGPPIAKTLLARLSAEQLSACGVSGPKQRTLRALIAHFDEHPDILPGIGGRDDATILAQLTAVKGIGPWSVDMFLMFGLGRPDILPVGDLGLRMGVMDSFKLGVMPNAAGLLARAEPWRPYRSVATWYFWRSRGPVPQSGQGG